MTAILRRAPYAPAPSCRAPAWATVLAFACLVLTLPVGSAIAQQGPGAGGDEEGYVRETHGDWQVFCQRRDGGEVCRLLQVLDDPNGHPVAEIGVFPLSGNERAAAGAQIVTPLETLLTEGIAIDFPNNTSKKYPYGWCTEGGCVARVGFTTEELASLRQGRTATMTIVAVWAPDQRIPLTISLTGFTAGFAALGNASGAAGN